MVKRFPGCRSGKRLRYLRVFFPGGGIRRPKVEFPLFSGLFSIRWVILVLFFLSGSPPASCEFQAVAGPCGFVFPRDHGAHRGYRTEWWYYSGFVSTPDDRRFGFHAAFFRNSLSQRDESRTKAQEKSAWRTRAVWFAHASVTDIETGRYLTCETISRGALKLAGAEPSSSGTTLYVNRWQAVIAGDNHEIQVDCEAFSFRLTLTAEKSPVSHGADGFSRKGRDTNAATCYYSITRLSAAGFITVSEHRRTVAGEAWMDHEYGSNILSPGISGWDWFGLRFTDGRELMAGFLRGDADAGSSPYVYAEGTLVSTGGVARRLDEEELALTVQKRWKSPVTGAIYPVQWRLVVRPLHARLDISAMATAQEITTPKTANLAYWEGVVRVSGVLDRTPVRGGGYAELTGYDRPVSSVP